jgi:hypothetical protein
VALAIPITTLATDYTDFTSQDAPYVVGGITVANNPAVLQFIYGLHGQNSYSPEYYIAPSSLPIYAPDARPIRGLRAKNAVAGSNAIIFGNLFTRNEPQIQAGTPFDSTVSPSGGVTPVGPVTGAVLGYVEATADVPITATALNGTTIVAMNVASAVAMDGATAVMVRGFIPAWFNNNNSRDLTLVLGQTSLPGIHVKALADTRPATTKDVAGYTCWWRYIPSAGNHYWSLAAFTNTGTNVTVRAGDGLDTDYVPASLLVTIA